jgi:hypothetical protein
MRAAISKPVLKLRQQEKIATPMFPLAISCLILILGVSTSNKKYTRTSKSMPIRPQIAKSKMLAEW